MPLALLMVQSEMQGWNAPTLKRARHTKPAARPPRGRAFSYWVETDHAIVLEWVSKGRLNDGQPVQDAGVSVIEKGDGKVQRFRTY